MPPQLARAFKVGEVAVLRIVADEVLQRGCLHAEFYALPKDAMRRADLRPPAAASSG
jgi:hypothetical protein